MSIPVENRPAPTGTEPRNSAGSIDDVAWHGTEIPEVERHLGTGPAGLSRADVAERLIRFGANELADAEPSGDWRILLSQFRSPLAAVLILAGIVTVAMREWVDASVIGIVVVVNSAIGFFQERQADRAVRALQALLSPRARVIRERSDWEIESRELVPGDIVILDSGARVPADLRLISATALLTDESALTGESLPVRKRSEAIPVETPLSDRVNSVFAGTIVVSGRGRGYVIATGSRTALGSIARATQSIRRATTPFQHRLDRFVRVIGIGVVACAVLAFAIGMATGEPASKMFLVAVALAVSAIPEGLPIAFTVTLSIGVRRMARRRAIVRHLDSVEALGSTTVIGSDKTGTLTENRMTVRRLWVANREETIAGPWDGGRSDRRFDGVTADRLASDPLYQLLLAGVLTNEARADRTDDGVVMHGDPTEAALLIAAMRYGLEPTELQEQAPPIAELPFESERQFSLSVRMTATGPCVFVKGAPERVLAMCSTMLTTDGLVAVNRGAVIEAMHQMASDGLRVLAMAVGAGLDDDAISNLEWTATPRNLTFVGLQGMADPPRDGARTSVDRCRAAGIRVVMITGDHAGTAQAVARELGIARDGAAVLTGVELAGMTAPELELRIRDVDVYARVTPEQKLEIVRCLQKQGEVVTVTGDGVNDAPALRAADIGVAMGKRGTDVAKAAADIVLTDDNFVSIAAAVEEGRITLANIRKVVAYLFSANVAEVLIVLGALALGWPLPLVAAQILWLNLATDSFQVVALAFEPAGRSVMNGSNRQSMEGILSPALWRRVALSGIVVTIATLGLFRWELDNGASERQAQTVVLTAMVLFQMAQAINMRSEHRSIFRLAPWSNPYLLAAVVFSIALHVATLYTSFTQTLLKVEPIDWPSWGR
ncbi:MAG: HAD-IC family P-type ATPase, partial [Thermomicrobiales bacterium]|nr:HAD-IC family P-type ATPase [Thermomicrobiales bacterium]